MQRWTFDATSLVSLALVVAATAALPAPSHFALLGSEAFFALLALLRYRSHDRPAHMHATVFARSSSGSSSNPASALLALPLRWLGAYTQRVWPGGVQHGQADEAHAAAAAASIHAAARGDELCPELIVGKLLDPQEGHLPVLSGGHLMSQWYLGLSGAHQMQPHHVSRLLAYLLPNPCKPAPDSAAPSTPAPASASAATHAADCPKIRSWASQLMRLLHLPAVSDSGSDTDSEVPPPSSPSSTSSLSSPTEPKLLSCQDDPLVAAYRPLIFYVLMELVAAATHVALLGLGFRVSDTPHGTATVYERPGTTGTTSSGNAQRDVEQQQQQREGSEPVVFLHGIGVGLAPYLGLLRRLVGACGGRRTVFAVQYKHVSMRFTTRIPQPHEVAADVAAHVRSRGASRVSVLGHSYGTLVASALNKLAAGPAPALSISRLTLVDPVCFAMFLPHLVRNAIYKQPLAEAAGEEAAAPKPKPGLARQLLNGLVTGEFHCSVALRRRLDWARVNLWPSELPPAATVVLSGRDNLVPVREVRDILANRAALMGPSAPQPTVLFNEAHGHGGFLGDMDAQLSVLGATLGMDVETVAANLEQQQQQQRAPRPIPRAAPLGVPAFATAAATLAPALAQLPALADLRPASAAPSPAASPARAATHTRPSPFTRAAPAAATAAATAAPHPAEVQPEHLLLGAVLWQRCLAAVEQQEQQLVHGGSFAGLQRALTERAPAGTGSAREQVLQGSVSEGACTPRAPWLLAPSLGGRTRSRGMRPSVAVAAALRHRLAPTRSVGHAARNAPGSGGSGAAEASSVPRPARALTSGPRGSFSGSSRQWGCWPGLGRQQLRGQQPSAHRAPHLSRRPCQAPAVRGTLPPQCVGGPRAVSGGAARLAKVPWVG